jgi:hypothetical protein
MDNELTQPLGQLSPLYSLGTEFVKGQGGTGHVVTPEETDALRVAQQTMRNQDIAFGRVAPLETDANRIAMGLTNPVYHGGREPWTVFDPEKLSDRTLSTKLGIHLAPDPEIAGANPFTHPHKDWGGPGGNVKPLYTYPDEKFYEIPQPIDPSSTASEHDPMWKRLMHDDGAVGADIKRVVYAKNPDLLAQSLNDIGVHHTEMRQAAQDLLANKPVEYKTIFGAQRGFENFEDYLNQTGALIPDNDAHRDLLLKEYQRELKNRGYVGVKYINTFAEEVAKASDPSSYILFPTNPKSGEPFPLRSRFAKFDPSMAESRDIGHASGGEVNDTSYLSNLWRGLKSIPKTAYNYLTNTSYDQMGSDAVNLAKNVYHDVTEHPVENLLGALPVVGSGMSAYDAYKLNDRIKHEYESGNYENAQKLERALVLSSLGAIPIFGELSSIGSSAARMAEEAALHGAAETGSRAIANSIPRDAYHVAENIASNKVNQALDSAKKRMFADVSDDIKPNRDIGHAYGGEVNNALHLARHLMGGSHG